MDNLDNNHFEVKLNTYNGPLDVLLELAKSQKVNLENISITKLADQFHDFITKAKNLNLEFKAHEVAEKLKLQLKKLELIRLLSDQMLKRERLGKDVFMRGIKGSIKSIYHQKYSLTLYELLKTYSSIIMTKDFQVMNIPKLPVYTTEEGIERIKNFFGKLNDWKNIDDLIPSNFKSSKTFKRTGKAGIFAGSLELVKEGNIKIKQDKLFENLYIKETNDQRK